jgi:hypothetical protein
MGKEFWLLCLLWGEEGQEKRVEKVREHLL